jgi:hypothetical protein
VDANKHFLSDILASTQQHSYLALLKPPSTFLIPLSFSLWPRHSLPLRLFFKHGQARLGPAPLRDRDLIGDRRRVVGGGARQRFAYGQPHGLESPRGVAQAEPDEDDRIVEAARVMTVMGARGGVRVWR